MVMGRPKKPRVVKERQGTLRPHREKKPEAQIAPGMPECPEALTDGAKEEWCRVCKDLYDAGLLSKVDRGALAIYCDNWDRWMVALEVLKTKDAVIETPNGSLIRNPHLAILNQAQDKCGKFAAKFGMAPADRASITARPPEEESAKKGKRGKPDKAKVVTGYFE